MTTLIPIKPASLGSSGISLAEYRALITTGSAKQKPKKRINRPEEDLQRDCVIWADSAFARKKYPLLAYLFHPANGGGRSKAEAGALKACGVRKGVPDFLLPIKSTDSPFLGLVIELKSDIGRLSEEQRDWLQKFKEEGYLASVARTIDEFISLVETFYGDASIEPDENFEIGKKRKMRM